MSTNPSLRRALIAVSVGGLAALGVAGTASAHVSIAEGEVTAGAYTLLTFGVPHGCEGSPTTEVRIQMPEAIPQVTPTVDAQWDVTKVMEPLATPIDGGHGQQLTERVAEVVYTARAPLPEGYRQAFVLSLQIPADASGTLSFPTIQSCEVGETAWIEQPTDDGVEPEHPAPSVDVVAADDAADPEVDAGGDDDTDGATTGLAVAGLVAGLGGLGLGGVALARSRRR